MLGRVRWARPWRRVSATGSSTSTSVSGSDSGRRYPRSSAHGEGIFRAAETDELIRCADELDAVVATGGGAFCDEANREIIIGSKGVSVFLDLPWDELDRRLAADNGCRPMYDHAEQARSLFEQRRPEYLRADVVITLEGSETPDDVAERVIQALARSSHRFRSEGGEG